ncbi:hypothetical protein [Actinoplanes sp. G11-F43]|uniref:hypothetical protein n=1 Tax=Actinoplanes sp. G11-F43 TaxID=3424130 RepID=UPI003D330DB0
MVLGLPFAVVTGWALGAPSAQQATLDAHKGFGGLVGDGGIGSAPIGSTPTRDTGYAGRPPRATADPVVSPTVPTVGPTIVTTTVTVIHSVPPQPTGTTGPPLLTDPPVPTPTMVTDPPSPSETPPSPSATSTPSVSAPSGTAPAP